MFTVLSECKFNNVEDVNTVFRKCNSWSPHELVGSGLLGSQKIEPWTLLALAVTRLPFSCPVQY